jgi:hypothetical protein
MTEANPPAPCPICGHSEFVWGELQAQGIQFVTADASLLERFFAFGTSLRARLCGRCGNVQMFANESA